MKHSLLVAVMALITLNFGCVSMPTKDSGDTASATKDSGDTASAMKDSGDTASATNGAADRASESLSRRGRDLTGKETQLVMPSKASPEVKAKILKCVDESNQKLRDFGQPEIVVIDEQQNMEDKLATGALVVGGTIAAVAFLPVTAVAGAVGGGLGFLRGRSNSATQRQINAKLMVEQCLQFSQ